MFGRLATAAVLAACLWAGVTQAMDWRWTENQGWAQSLGVARSTARDQLAYAFQLEQDRDYHEASRQYLLYLRQYGDADPDTAGRALARLARCLHATDNHVAAFNALETVLRDYPSAATRVDLLRMELVVGKRLMSPDATSTILGPAGDSRAANRRQAAQIFRTIVEHDPYGPVAPEALYNLGQTLTLLEDTLAAQAAFQRILDQHPQSEFVEHARLGLMTVDGASGSAHDRNVQEQIRIVRDVTANMTDGDAEALQQFEEVQLQVNEKKPAEMLRQADEYRRMRTSHSLKSAEFLYTEIIYRYPRSPQAETARERLGTFKVPKASISDRTGLKPVNPLNWFRSDSKPDWVVQSGGADIVRVEDVGPIPGVEGMPPQGDVVTTLVPPHWGTEVAAVPVSPPRNNGEGNILWQTDDPPRASNLNNVVPPMPVTVVNVPAANPLPQISDADLVPLPDLGPSRAGRSSSAPREYVAPPSGRWNVSPDFQ